MGKMIIVVAPSGAGKSTFIDEILKYPELLIKDTITYTTRGMRDGESEGEPYFFLKEEDFKSKMEDNFFVEWAKVHSSFYGTSHRQIREFWQAGFSVIMDVDIQGAETFKNKFPEALVVFIQPPSLETLKSRLLKRGDGKLPPDYEVRMESAKKEMAWAKNADEIVINDDFSQAFQEFRKKVELYLKSA
ncbi:MAG: guanylate kinase [Bdellovibrionales bacterium]